VTLLKVASGQLVTQVSEFNGLKYVKPLTVLHDWQLEEFVVQVLQPTLQATQLFSAALPKYPSGHVVTHSVASARI
jgi:hypothetical protein